MSIMNIPLYAWLLTVGGVVFILGRSWSQRKKIHANDIASFATTTGIFFTFLGIVLALGELGYRGEEASVQQRIYALLGGIFTAFIPSVFGAGIAVATYRWPEYWRKPIEEDDEQETDIDAQILQELKRLNTNIIGEGETSLNTRLQKFQLKVTENQDALKKEFQDFAKNVADNIIEALKQSMKDLNDKLGEQFGENFGRFADVIPRLLEWQENYQKTIEDTQRQLQTQSNHMERLLESLKSVDKSFTDIAEHTATIATHSKRIDDLMQAVRNSFDQIFNGVKEMRADAEQFQVATQSLTENIARQTELTETQKQALEQSATSLTGIAEKAAILDGTAQQLNQHINTMTLGLGGIERLSSTLQGKAESIEQNMKNLTEKTVMALASNLRGISQALVDDYRAVHEVIKKIRGMGP